MRVPRKISVLGTAATAALAVVLTGGSAHAAPAPSTSPSVSHPYYSDPAKIPACRSGYACAIVAYGSGYYVFNFYDYGTYSLSNWNGQGGLTNRQTGGAAFHIYNSGGGQIDCVSPAPITDEVNWSPAWSVKLTSTGC